MKHALELTARDKKAGMSFEELSEFTKNAALRGCPEHETPKVTTGYRRQIVKLELVWDIEPPEYVVDPSRTAWDNGNRP